MEHIAVPAPVEKPDPMVSVFTALVSALFFCRGNQQAGHFDKPCASPRSESQDMKAKSAVTALVVSCDTVAQRQMGM